VGEIGVANPFREVGSDDVFAVLLECLAVEIGKDFERVMIALVEMKLDVGAVEGHGYAALWSVVRDAETLKNTASPAEKLGGCIARVQVWAKNVARDASDLLDFQNSFGRDGPFGNPLLNGLATDLESFRQCVRSAGRLHGPFN